MSEEIHKRAFETYENATVSIAEIITPRNIHLRFDLPAGHKISFKPGQFVQVFVPIDDKVKRTSYSIASSNYHHEYIELCVTKVDGGKSSTWLHSLKVGDKVTIMGPLGKFSLPETIKGDITFICTGSGVAPFRSMINHLHHEKFNGTVRLLFGNRFDDDIIYLNEWEKLKKEWDHFKAFFTLSRPTEKWNGPKGYVGEKIAEFVPNPQNNDYFICGLSNMINAVQEKLLALGVPPANIHFEKYD